MKGVFTTLVAGMMFLTGCGNKDLIHVSGHIDNPGNVKVVTFYEGDRKLDSVFLADGNRFTFERNATQPRLLSLGVGNNKYPIILTPGEKLTFVADMHQPEAYTVEGSKLSTALKDFAPYKRRKEFVQDSLQAAFAKATLNKSAEEIERLRFDYLTEFKSKLALYTRQAVDFARKQPNLAGFYAISTLDPEVAEAEIVAYAEEIKDKFQDSRYVSQFKDEAKKLKRLAVGQPAPEIASFTPNNRAVSLSDFRGKYVLVDFWASWCAPCRQENPNIVQQYHAFKNKNFTVLGVSLDNNPGSWMRAIQDDKLEWTQVADLQAWNSAVIADYRIKAIPTSYLLDPRGIIIAKNLRGKALELFLEKTLN
ncbi:TlpA disulfide reductase family protein [Sphingobacterium griseoflavum]|uniref:Thiol:disulfide interchange protein n=1 Tax=Sphingobacterium griseoflavum TaxID=1474952 RepID=A0ABQ3HSW4_9SPHI|nr:TlpA disulfide reductase family protein [Sphingobacterium griseoflavum]GHE23438.1 thiol:disulfide interchange protein [Sphingobacterium griseoflavum]